MCQKLGSIDPLTLHTGIAQRMDLERFKTMENT